jgi:hypothetical protein
MCKIGSSRSSGYERDFLLGHDAVQSVETHPTLRRNVSPCLVALLLGLVFKSEDGYDMFARNSRPLKHLSERRKETDS